MANGNSRTKNRRDNGGKNSSHAYRGKPSRKVPIHKTTGHAPSKRGAL